MLKYTALGAIIMVQNCAASYNQFGIFIQVLLGKPSANFKGTMTNIGSVGCYIVCKCEPYAHSNHRSFLQ